MVVVVLVGIKSVCVCSVSVLGWGGGGVNACIGGGWRGEGGHVVCVVGIRK